MFKFLHAADIHLDSPLVGLERYEGAPVDQIRGATRQAFEKLVDLAIDEGAAFVLLAGDLYDGDWKDYNTGLFFISQMVRLKGAEIRVFVIAGNHDAGSTITKALQPPDNVKRFSTRKPETAVLDDLGVAIHGQGFPTRSVTEDLSARYPDPVPDLFNIGMLHTSLNGRPGHEPYAPCSVDGLRSRGYQYWALGHVHAREVVSVDPWIVFPGNIQGRHVRETGAKGCSLVAVDDGEVVSVEDHAVDIVRWEVCTVDVTGAAVPETALDLVGKALKQVVAEADDRYLAVRLQLEGACLAHERLSAAPEHWAQAFRALGTDISGANLWIEKVCLGTRRETDLGEALKRDDALGGLLRAIRDLEADPDRLAALADEMSDLKLKLPPELMVGEESMDPTDPRVLREAAEHAKDLLLYRLVSSEDEA